MVLVFNDVDIECDWLFVLTFSRKQFNVASESVTNESCLDMSEKLQCKKASIEEIDRKCRKYTGT